jgi:SOS response regulatory protein OraA/RecX
MTKPMKRLPTTAQNKMMDLIGGRDHSETELRQKLNLRFTAEEIDAAIEYGKAHHWIPETAEDQTRLSQNLAEVLHRKNKGVMSINHQLHEKGLPLIESDSRLELDKALALVKNKYSVKDGITHEEMAKFEAKVGRFLISRGFDEDTVSQALRKVINEKF